MAEPLAINGGTPVRESLLPYGRQSVDEKDINAVVEVLRGNWLTTGPEVEAFEADFAAACGADHAVAVSSGTAALHAIVHAHAFGPGDEVVVPALTFVATANSLLYEGATPVFADVEADTLLLDCNDAESRLTSSSRAIVAVDFAGQPCDYDALDRLSAARDIAIVADACHALGATFRGKPVGNIASATAFSLHPVKHVTTGEGGMIATADPAAAETMRRFRNHGIDTDQRQRLARGAWYYEMNDLGYNYRLTDIQCALGRSQLAKLPGWIARRREIAGAYDRAFAGLDAVEPLAARPDSGHAYHLYIIKLRPDAISATRDEVFAALRAEGIGVNVHYLPVYLHPYYRERFGTGPGLCPVAEDACARMLTLPLFPTMSDEDIRHVVDAVTKVVTAYEV